MYPLLIPRSILLPIAIIAFLITMFGAWLKISHGSFFDFSPNLILGIGSGILIFVWVVAAADAVRNGVKNPFMWIVAFLSFGSLASIFYLYHRDHIIIKKRKNFILNVKKKKNSNP